MITVQVYEDMSKYQFLHFENAFNIGWHNNIEPINMNNESFIDSEFLIKLKIHCQFRLNVDRCGKYRANKLSNREYLMPFGEIRILDLDKNIRYAAPNIIYDDILDKLYCPSKEFVEAVKNSPLPTDSKYIEFFSRYTSENLYGEDEQTIAQVKLAMAAIQDDNIHDFLKKNQYIINCVTEKGSLLNYAIENKKNQEARVLIDEGININSFEGIELITALNTKQGEIAKILISKNISINSESMATNPIFGSIWAGLGDVMEELINKKPKLLKTYTNEFVKNWTAYDAVNLTKNNELINRYKRAIKKSNNTQV